MTQDERFEAFMAEKCGEYTPNDYEWNDMLLAWHASLAAERARWVKVAEQVIEEIRMTREYVGEHVLPNLPGWSHYEATQRLRAAIAAEEGE